MIRYNLNSYYQFPKNKRRNINKPIFTLDINSDAVAGYALRKLKSSYNKYAIRVKRSSDNDEKDIGFNNSSYLDTYSLSSFVTTNSAYITTFYDQTGNENHLIQPLSVNQPEICSNGNIYTVNGRPSIYFDGSNYYLTANSLSGLMNGSDNLLSFFTAIYPIASSGTTCSLIGFGNSTLSNPVFILGIKTLYCWLMKRDNIPVTKQYSTINITNYNSRSDVWSFSTNSVGTSGTLEINGVTIYDNIDIDVGYINSDTFAVGALVKNVPQLYFNGYISELILYNKRIDTKRIQSEQIKYYRV